MSHPNAPARTVALFVPCYVDQLAPEVGLATLRVLERAGCEVRYDPGQTCCGQPFLNAGAEREARRLARLHTERFGRDDVDAIVCPSGSCTAAVRERYPEIGEARDEAGTRMRERTLELGEFLVRKLGRTDLGARFPHRVALLQSCHGLRDLELGRPSERGPAPGGTDAMEPGPTEQLLRAVDGLELVFPARTDECCGFGGSFAVKYPELSARIGRDRLRALAATGADYVTGTDTSCLLHLDGLRRRAASAGGGSGPQVIHLAQVLASSGASGGEGA